MNLFEAFEEMKKGKAVRRSSSNCSLAYHNHENVSWFTWKSKDKDYAYGSSEESTHYGAQKINIKDALETDWEIVE